MANAAEQLRALLTQQRNVLTQLQPSQNELFGLVAKLRDLSLEASHGEITSYFEVAKKRYDFLEHKLRDQRKALDLELLGSDAGLEGEISENDAHRGNEEEKWAPKLMVRIEKMSSAKFLEFCNEQTTVVNNIWGCSANLRRTLNQILNRDLEEDASTASHDNPSAYADTEQSEASYPQGKSSEKEELQHELDNAKLEIEQLKSKILDLESQKNVPRPIEVTQSQNIEDLKKQIEGSEADTKKAKRDKEATELKLEGKIAELAAAILKISALEEELKMKKPLFDVGVKVRCGFLQSVKRVWVDGYYVTTHPPLDVKAIWEKNEAVHRGNYEADKALFDLKIFQTTPEKPAAFHYAYDIDSGHNLSACPKALTLVNYRGTLMACGFLTKYTHSKAEDDRAKKYFDECKSIWLPIFSSSGIDVEKQKAFENDTSLTAKFKALRTITEETVKKEQKRLSG